MTRGALAVSIAVALATAACGRVAFDERGDAVSGNSGDGAGDTAAIPAGAVLWAPLDDLSSTTIADVAGGHSISCQSSTCPTSISGKHGGGAHFSGSAMSGLPCAYRADLSPGTGFTAAVWINLDAYPADFACALSKPIAPDDKDTYSLCVQPTHEALFYSEDGGADDYQVGPAITLGAWHHLAMTWDGTTKRGYLDGTSVTSGAVTITGDASPVLIGTDANFGSPVYQIQAGIDDVMIFDRALDATEVAQLAQ